MATRTGPVASAASECAVPTGFAHRGRAAVLLPVLAHAATSGSNLCFESLQEESDGSVAWNLAGILEPTAAAVPVPEPGYETDQFSDYMLRTVFSGIAHRQDTPGEQVAGVLMEISVNQYFPFTHPERYEVGRRLNSDSPDRSAEFQE